MKQFFIKNKINLLFVFLFFYFYYYPIISLNLKYRDDYIRYGILMSGFINEGRIVSRIVLDFFSFTDGILITPLTQILSVFCITCTIIFTSNIIFKKINFFSFSIVSLIFLNPFYLQNMSFGYDSLPMTISTCSAVISASLVLQTRYYAILTTFLALIILLSYQTTLGVYINCLLFILCKHYLENDWNNDSNIYTRAIIGIGIYILLGLIFTAVYPYLFGISDTRFIIGLSHIKTNLFYIIYYIKVLFSNIPYVIYVTGITTAFSLIIFHLKQYQNKKLKLVHIAFSLIIIPLLYVTTLLAAEGPSILIKFEVDNLRVLIAVSFLWVISFYFISLFSKSLYYIFYFIFTAFCFSTSYSYGVFLKDQNQFFNMLISNINYDIGHTTHSADTKIITLNPLPLSKSNQKLTTKVPFLLYVYGEQDFDWLAPFKLLSILPYTPPKNLNKICETIRNINSNKTLNMKIIQSNNYTLYFDKNNVAIDFYTQKKNEYCDKIQ